MKNPLHPISSPNVVADDLITSTVPYKITAVITIIGELKLPIPTKPISFAQLRMVSLFAMLQAKKVRRGKMSTERQYHIVA